MNNRNFPHQKKIIRSNELFEEGYRWSDLIMFNRRKILILFLLLIVSIQATFAISIKQAQQALTKVGSKVTSKNKGGLIGLSVMLKDLKTVH